MLQVTPQMRILIAIKPVDFRKGIDGLVQLCRTVLQSQPFSGTVFVFRNRRQTSVKMLVYDGQGFWLAQKRMSVGKFRYWPNSVNASSLSMHAHELAILLRGGEPSRLNVPPEWRSLPQSE